MTNQDAIDILEHTLEDLSVRRGSDYSGVEALKMAISVFKKYGDFDEQVNTDRRASDGYNA